MKILFVAPGDSLHTSRWVERVKDQEVDCIYYDITEESEMHPIDITKVFRLENQQTNGQLEFISKKVGSVGKLISSLILTFRHYQRIREVIALEKPDLIHLHWLFHSASLATSFINGVPIISTPWGSDLLTPEYKVKSSKFDRLKHRFVIKRVVKNSVAFCCDAPHMKDSLIAYGAKANSVQIIYFGTDVGIFSPEKREPNFWEQYGLKKESIKVLSNRVLADMYDIETLIRSSKIVSKTAEDIVFIIAGGGPQAISLQAYAQAEGTEKGITFTGRLNNDDFAKATSSCDIYVSTSPTDGGIAASVAEAMSAGVPVVVTDFGDNSTWLKNQTAGFIFQTGNEFQLSELILKLASDKKMREYMGEAGRRIILKENNSVIEIRKIISLYDSVRNSK